MWVRITFLISQSFHFCCFHVWLKKKRKENTVSEIFEMPWLCAPHPGTSGLSLPSSLLSLGGQFGDFTGAQPSPTIRMQESLPVQLPLSPRPTVVSMNTCCLLWNRPVASLSDEFIPPSAASCTHSHTTQVL